MKEKVYSYIIAVMIFLMGAGAAWIIMHLGDTTTTSKLTGTEASYAQLQKSILNNP